ncbi:MAG: ATP-binding cassette domain-containing protein [Erysipelotrichales bacterium]
MSYIEILNVEKTFNKDNIDENKVLNGIDIIFNEGDFICVIGGNGAGKSTFLNTLAGVIKPEKGSILLNGNDITNQSIQERSKYISRVFQDPLLGSCPTLSIEENLSLAYKRGHSRKLVKAIKKDRREFFTKKLKSLDLGIENRLKSEVGLLSGGQRQALTLLMATLEKPSLLLLDEHTAALDPKTRTKVLKLTEQLVNKDKITTLMVTHDMEDAIKYGNRLIMLHEGRVLVDIDGKEKENLSVNSLLELFHHKSGAQFSNDVSLLK